MKLCVSKISDGVAIFKLFENVCALFELFPLVIHLSFYYYLCFRIFQFVLIGA